MRIIAGALSGRRLRPPADSRVRPTGDRVKEAWFSIVGEVLAGARVLDLFAGSGALGLEALSRGAAHATFVELNRSSLAALRSNIAALGVASRATVLRRDALRFVAKLGPDAFDVAFADPPYDTNQAERLVAAFRAKPFARILGIEHSPTQPLTGDESRSYGNVALTFCYRP